MNKIQEKPVNKRELEGIVVSDKMDKTIAVEVTRVFRHPMLGKTVKSKKKYLAHDENGKAKMGDRVRISFCRPMSKRKYAVLTDVVTTTAGSV